jgi:hypothetical protein
MISAENVKELDQRKISYIFGARMRKVKEIREDVLSYPGRYREIRPEGALSKDPAPLKVKEVVLNGKRYIVCLNPKQARKDAKDRQAIIDSLQEKRRLNQIPKVSSAIKGIENTSRSRRTASGLIKTRSRGNPDLMANGC